MRTDSQVTLNRAVFTQTAFESRALTVLTTLLHRFTEPGRYRVHVQHPAMPVRDLTVNVSKDAKKTQENIDLSGTGDRGHDCCCGADEDIELAVNGVLGLYPSTGVGGYRVTVSSVPAEGTEAPASGRDERTLLDTEKGVPAGDYFAVVLTRPGTYLLTARDARAEVKVELPRRERLRTDQPTLVVLGAEGFRPGSVSQLAGRALVVQCDVDALLRVELVEPEGGGEREDRRKHTYRRPRRPGPEHA